MLVKFTHRTHDMPAELAELAGMAASHSTVVINSALVAYLLATPEGEATVVHFAGEASDAAGVVVEGTLDEVTRKLGGA